jgi:hypothetical protein
MHKALCYKVIICVSIISALQACLSPNQIKPPTEASSISPQSITEEASTKKSQHAAFEKLEYNAVAKAFSELNVPPRGADDESGTLKKWLPLSTEDSEKAVFELWQDLVSSETLRAKSKTPVTTDLRAPLKIRVIK